MQKSITIAGKRYVIATRPYDSLISIKGNGVNDCLPEGATLDSSDLRAVATATVERCRENRRRAGEELRRSLGLDTTSLKEPRNAE